MPTEKKPKKVSAKTKSTKKSTRKPKIEVVEKEEILKREETPPAPPPSPPEPVKEKSKLEILTEHYERLVSSKMTPRAIERWLDRNIDKTDLPVFCSIGRINADIRQEPFKRVAIEVWQNARVLRGKDRYRFRK